MQEAFARIGDEYSAATRELFAGHPLASYIRHEIPALLRSYFRQFPDIIWEASAGKGRWANAPWVAALNPLVTETPQRGYYPVYLFTRSLDQVYLSLNQGVTDLRDEFGTVQSKAILRQRADILRVRLAPEFRQTFRETTIDLQSGDSWRLEYYEYGHAFGVRYDLGKLPSTEALVSDMAEMLRLYTLAVERGGTEPFDVEQASTGALQADLDRMTLDEKRRLRYHRKVERNQRLVTAAKRIHGYTCQVCGFSFAQSYGDLGREYIEAHHLTPLAQLPPNEPVRLSPKDDFAVVCANCHSMIHHREAPPTFEEFRALWQRQHP